ncbi:MAG: hypothetical protein Kow0069_12780 [Promethearchaeota archaeon]
MNADLILRFHFDFKKLRLPQRFAYYVDLFQGHLQRRGFVGQVEEVADGAIVFTRGLSAWIEKMLETFGLFKFFKVEPPDWIKDKSGYWLEVKFEVVSADIPDDKFQRVMDLPNVLFRLYGVELHFAHDQREGSLFVRTREDVLRLIDMLVQRFEEGKLLFED